MLTNYIKRSVIIAIALAVGFLLYGLLPYEEPTNKGLALLAFVAILWLTEAIHITVTALLVPVLAILLGLESTKSALQAFANPTIFLFFGGFAIATALSVQKLDKYIAHKVIAIARGNFLLAVFFLFLATALLSMGISNTATAAMIIPLAIGLLKNIDYESNKGTYAFVILGVAYSASIGGMGTLVGSPPNAIVASQLNITFSEWLRYGMPTVLGLMPLMIGTLYVVFRPKLNIKITSTEGVVDKLNGKQYLTILIFLITALCWIFSDLINETLTSFIGIEKIKDFDAVVAMIAAVFVCFFGVAEWKQIQENTDWGVLMLFGGGLSLSVILTQSGASKALVDSVQFLIADSNYFVIGLMVATFIIFLTEFTSNTASAALLVPIFISVAENLGVNPLGLSLIIGIGASCAFMLPVATPPNAIAYGTGKVSQRDMIKAGFVLNILCIIFISVVAYYFWR
ncbi:anion transporter [Capnocytophaga ochracea DSM 7271]|jgi:transporter, DASS family|uniref:Anion transporter n=1 Tax=Capnocytophaga ochracea (strain ATCC 27872 / DSM 7271 / CCUG 9716 / JCM 12966 / NCTC 12371 / SS31 / VPI 2845) TaxID=521097 RepID=C7M8H3_CAPOD|nr:DASS family sodium-coupled anion symporter [Capnocytophaga ochracea]ACU92343.1 anion transporter [Capnocytophaga ochracea DSM 7271]UAK51089.1 DASS family sodium-coupled anion symporter [Capnocytophaga ochracea]